MNGLCGWSGPLSEHTEAREVLKEMSQCLRVAGRGTTIIHNLPLASAAVVVGRQGEAGIHHDDRVLVGWEGRIYWNSSELTGLAEREGHGRAIAVAYEKWGPEALKEVHGSFALAIVDSMQPAALIAVDRMGTRPMYCCTVRDGVVFGSTAKAVNRHPTVRRSLDLQAIYNYVYFHIVPSPRAIYEGMERLQPGEYALFKPDSVEKGFYWQPDYEDYGSTPEAELAEEFRQCLRKALRRSIEGGGNVGAFLSGGTDSSTIAGLLSEIQPPAKTYSVRFDAEEFDESRYAEITARHFETQHHVYTLTPGDVLDAVPRLAQAYDQPFGNASAVASYYGALMARSDRVETMLGGDGGDEIFAGNARYAKQTLFEYYSTIPAMLRKAAESLVLPLPSGGVGPLKKLKSYIQQARVPLPDRLETYNFLQRTRPREVFHSDLLESVDPEEPLELNRAVYHRALAATHLNRMLYLDLKITLADNDLPKVTRTCELAGVNIRYPLLDEDVVGLSTKVPARLKMKGRRLRFFFKRALEDFLPEATINKKKHGFGVPCGLWFKTHSGMRELAHDSLASLGSRNLLDSEYLTRLMRLHETEHTDYYGVMIWVLVMLEQWLQYESR